MKSSLKNMIVVLLIITFVAAAAVGLIYKVTKEPITEAVESNKLAALVNVLPKENITNSPSNDKQIVTLEGIPITVYTAKVDDKVVGYAVETATKNGYAGEFKLMIGFTPEGDIVNIEVLSHSETPGLGSVMTEPGNPLILSFEGKNPADLKMSVRKDGGDIDALTASTITSRAYVDGVDRAYRAMVQVKTGGAIDE